MKSGWEWPRLNWRRMAVIVRKELLVLFSTRVSRMLLIVPPLAQIVIFGWAATMEVRNVRVAVLDHDAGRWSHELIQRLHGSPTFTSIRLLRSEAEMQRCVEQQEVLLALVFQQDFSRKLARGESAALQVILDGRRSNAAQIAAYYLSRIVEASLQEHSRSMAAGGGVVQVQSSTGSGAAASGLSGGPTGTAGSSGAGQAAVGAGPEQSSELMASPHTGGSGADAANSGSSAFTGSPSAGGQAMTGQASSTGQGFVPEHGPARLDVQIRCWFNPNLEFQWFFLPNLIGMLSFMLGLVVTGLTVAREREMGTFDQLLVSPATPTEIALAKLVPGCLVGLAHGTIFLLISVFGFGVPFTGSVLLLYVGMLIFAAASGGIGLMVSSLSATQQQAFLGAFSVGVPCILISGAVTPIINMPVFLQHASQLNPMRHFTVLCQGVFLKDITLAAAAVNLFKISLISVVAVTVAVWMFKRRV